MRRLTQQLGIVILAFVACRIHAQSLLLSGSRTGAAGNPLARTYLSANKQFRLTLEQINGPATMSQRSVELMATIAKLSGSSAEVIWSRKIEGRQVQWIMDFDVAVSDDGTFFVLAGQSGEQLAIYPREGGPWKFASNWDFSKERIPRSIFESTEIFGGGKRQYPPSPRSAHETYFRSRPEILFRLDKVDGENVVAFWWRDENLWEACRVSDGKKPPFKTELQERWNAETRREIIEILERARNGKALKSIGKLPRAVASLATNLVPEVKYGEIRETQYEFLATLRNPTDRVWFEALFDPKDDMSNRGMFWHPFFHPRRDSDAYCDYIDVERVVGDWLLSVFDGKIKKSQQSTRMSYEEAPRLNYLGRVEGSIQLSTPFQPHHWPMGPLRIQLLPTEASKKEQEKRRENVEFHGGYHVMGNPQTNPRPGVMKVPFVFGTVLPGKYQLKVIWDKRRPFTDKEKPGPGDYESSLSAPFEVVAGQTISNLIAYCTNRVSIAGTENYYAADELKAKLKE